MLAWVFWHARFAEVAEDEYRGALRSFHTRIAESKPDGFLGSRTLRYESVAWLNTPAEVYEDWYFVESSAGLDHLDEAAVAVFARDSHARVARLAETAAAGLYRLRAGSPLVEPSHCTWMSKPRKETYDAFIERVSPEGTVWVRQMVLGPTPEFCIEADRSPSDHLREVIVHVLQPALFDQSFKRGAVNSDRPLR